MYKSSQSSHVPEGEWKEKIKIFYFFSGMMLAVLKGILGENSMNFSALAPKWFSFSFE
jgi:hypothetical protein